MTAVESLPVRPLTPETVTAIPEGDAAAAGRLVLANGSVLEMALTSTGHHGQERCAFLPAAPGTRGALFMVVEGAPAETAAYLYSGVSRAIERDRGTPTARLPRAVRAGCRRLEAQALHRFELAGVGLTALLIEEGSAYFSQLLPSQAYVIEDGEVRSLPDVPMRGAALAATAAGRRWEVEIDLCRFAARPGAAFVLCTTSLAGEIPAGRLADCARLPAGEAAAGLLPGKTLGGPAGEAVIVRLAPAPARPPRARLLSLESQRRPRPLISAAGPQNAAPSGRPPVVIEAWGLRRDGIRQLPVVGGLLPGRQAHIRSGRRRSTLPSVLAGILGAVALAGGGAWWYSTQAPSRSRDVHTVVTPLALPTAQPLAGRTVSVAAEPYRTLAVAGSTTRVLDVLGRLVPADQAVPPAVVAAPPGSLAAPFTLLASRDGDVLALDGGRTLWRLSTGGEAPRPVPLRAASLWQRPEAIAVYAGSLYVLDAGAPGASGQIWRHAAGASGGYDGEAQAWLQPGDGISLDGVTGMAVDGSIWLSRSDGTVLKLGAGRLEPFTPRGLDTPLTNAAAVYTERPFQSLYVLDGAARRLLRLTKGGEFESQVMEVVPVGDQARGLWVDEPGRRALILTDRRLQEIGF